MRLSLLLLPALLVGCNGCESPTPVYPPLVVIPPPLSSIEGTPWAPWSTYPWDGGPTDDPTKPCPRPDAGEDFQDWQDEDDANDSDPALFTPQIREHFKEKPEICKPDSKKIHSYGK